MFFYNKPNNKNNNADNNEIECFIDKIDNMVRIDAYFIFFLYVSRAIYAIYAIAGIKKNIMPVVLVSVVLFIINIFITRCIMLGASDKIELYLNEMGITVAEFLELIFIYEEYDDVESLDDVKRYNRDILRDIDTLNTVDVDKKINCNVKSEEDLINKKENKEEEEKEEDCISNKNTLMIKEIEPEIDVENDIKNKNEENKTVESNIEVKEFFKIKDAIKSRNNVNIKEALSLQEFLDLIENIEIKKDINIEDSIDIIEYNSNELKNNTLDKNKEEITKVEKRNIDKNNNIVFNTQSHDSAIKSDIEDKIETILNIENKENEESEANNIKEE